MARAGLVLPDLPPQSVSVNGQPRAFSVVPGSGPDAPLVLALHGAGGTGLGMAALTGLAQRGPEAGCAVAFPDGFMHVWNDRHGRRRVSPGGNESTTSPSCRPSWSTSARRG